MSNKNWHSVANANFCNTVSVPKFQLDEIAVDPNRRLFTSNPQETNLKSRHTEITEDGSWTKEALEEAGGAEELDAGQVGWSVRASTDVWTSQATRVAPSHSSPPKPPEVRPLLQRGQDDLQAATDKGGREGEDRDAFPLWLHG